MYCKPIQDQVYNEQSKCKLNALSESITKIVSKLCNNFFFLNLNGYFVRIHKIITEWISTNLHVI